MVTAVVALCVGSAVEVAVIVTVPPEGTVPGAVYVVAAPSEVCAGLKEPQPPAVPQVAVQSTPLSAESFCTEALALNCFPAVTEVGGAWENEIATGGGADTEINVVLAFAGCCKGLFSDAVAVACNATVKPPEGAVAGAV
jgi:hypothetical protein